MPSRKNRLRHLLCASFVAGVFATSFCRSAAAIVIAEDELEETSTITGLVARNFGFILAGPTLAPPYSTEDSSPTGMGIFDARAYFEHRAQRWKFVAHQQFTLQMQSHSMLGGVNLGRGVSPPRWLPLQFRHQDSGLQLLSNLDWFYADAQWGPATVTVGRQPVTIGRASVFRTLDRVSTFSLTEVDRTYKPGTDAVRLDLGFQRASGKETNISLIAAIAEFETTKSDLEVDLGACSFVGRFTHGLEDLELGATAGFIRFDGVLGVDAVWDLGFADLYGEATATWVTAKSLGAPFAPRNGQPVFSAVLGANLKPTKTLSIQPEVHYNGFGRFAASDYLPLATSRRVAIGEQTAFGKVYLANMTNWEATPLTNLFGGMIVNVHDPSALWTVGLRRSLSNNVELLGGAYAPIGRTPNTTSFTLRSEYGAYPYFFFSELKATL